eukprot:366469-Chlamydomonas_euryale.AAC.11
MVWERPKISGKQSLWGLSNGDWRERSHAQPAFGFLICTTDAALPESTLRPPPSHLLAAHRRKQSSHPFGLYPHPQNDSPDKPLDFRPYLKYLFNVTTLNTSSARAPRPNHRTVI